MPIHRQRLASGLLFLLIGLAFGSGAILRYPIGTAAQMGPGYFPLLLSIVLILLGFGIILQSVRLKRQAAPARTTPFRYDWRPVVYVLLANVVFGLLLRGAPALGLPAQGLVVSIYALVLISSLAGKSHSWTQAFILASILAAGCYALFIRGMGLPVPAWPDYF